MPIPIVVLIRYATICHLGNTQNCDWLRGCIFLIVSAEMLERLLQNRKAYRNFRATD